MSPFAGMSLAMAALVAGPAGCFMVPPGLLALPLLLLPAGLARWGWKWLAAASASVAVPLAGALAFGLSGEAVSAISLLRWSASICMGAFAARDAGVQATSWWLFECARRLGRGGGLLRDAAAVLASARQLAASAGAGMTSLEGGPGLKRRLAAVPGVVRRAFEAVPEASPIPAAPEMPPRRLAFPTLAWLFAMAGASGLGSR